MNSAAERRSLQQADRALQTSQRSSLLVGSLNVNVATTEETGTMTAAILASGLLTEREPDEFRMSKRSVEHGSQVVPRIEAV